MPPRDAALEMADARGDEAPPESYPPFENGSFGVTRGGAGPLAFELIEPLPLDLTLVEPWRACRPGFSAVEAARSDRSLAAPDVHPREGTTFIESELGLGNRGGLRQTLAVPLRRGGQYAFRIDARAAAGSRVALQLWGGHVECSQGVELFESEQLAESWTSICIRFVASDDFPQLMLVPVDAAEGIGARVFFDNVRYDPSCQ